MLYKHPHRNAEVVIGPQPGLRLHQLLQLCHACLRNAVDGVTGPLMAHNEAYSMKRIKPLGRYSFKLEID